MARGLSTANQNAAAASHAHVVYLAKMEFDSPVYLHSGVGTITYDSNDYLGVGTFGGVVSISESEQIEPKLVRMTLSGIDSTQLTEALDAGTFRDLVTIYQGYRQDDGTLVDDPFILDVLYYETAEIEVDKNKATITVSLKTDLARLNEASGARWTAEDHQQRFSGDEFFDSMADSITRTLEWGGKKITNPNAQTNYDWQERDAYDSGVPYQ